MTLPYQRITTLPFFPLNEPPTHLSDGTMTRRLNLNESPFPPAPSVVAAMTEAAMNAHRYGDGEAVALVDALAAHTGADRDRVFVGAGSNELLAAVADIALAPGDHMIAPDPAFPTYAKNAGIRDAAFTGVPVTADGRPDIGAMLAAVTERTRLMVVSSPHNPTGALLSEDEVTRLCTDLPDHVMLHFDEAYYEFGRAAGGPETLPILARRTGPWISTRTFSKAYALAGARIGYGIASSPEVALAMRKVRANFGLTAMAQAAAIAALEAEAHSAMIVDHAIRGGAALAKRLTALGFAPLPAAANFIATRSPIPAKLLCDQLAEAGILTGTFQMNGETLLRITIGTDEDMAALIDTISAITQPSET